eukprot:TRINITY_DN3569_c0_g2_i1.p1 TRINITY_DN3569_c0_g2~~TRINITY_DN3569_c0_g2_i1.p1  ORF type:complete len:1664 (-),score=228.44 TRINITY_DN3569_c0_g2_i1:158-4768(-)
MLGNNTVRSGLRTNVKPIDGEGCGFVGCVSSGMASQRYLVRATFSEDGYMTVTINDEVLGPRNPRPDATDARQVVQTMRDFGARIESSLFGENGNIGVARFDVHDVKVMGTVVQGMEPRGCHGAFPNLAFRSEAPALIHGGAVPWPEADLKATPVHVHVTNSTLGFPSPYHFGTNVPDFTPRKWFLDHAAGILKGGGFKFLRWPGGSDADKYIWNKDFETFSYFKDYSTYFPPEYIGTDDFIDICKEIGAEPLLQLNYAAFIMTGVDEALELAISWLRHFESRGLPVHYVELGNENYGPWELPQLVDKSLNVTGDRYGRHLQKLAKRLRSERRDVFVGAVVEDDGCPECHEWIQGVHWMRDLSPYLAGSADFLSYHNYFLKEWHEYGWTEATTQQFYRVASGNTVPVISKNIERSIRKTGGPHLPVALTEWNVDLANLDTWPDSHGSALAVADILVRMAVTAGGFAASNFFALCQSEGRVDLGLAARGDPFAADGTPRPVWYAFAMLRLVLGDRLANATISSMASVDSEAVMHELGAATTATTATTTVTFQDPPETVDIPTNVSVYASTFPSGEASMLLINRDEHSISACVTGLEKLGVEGWNRIRGWVLSPHSPLDGALTDSAKFFGSRWNGVSQVNDIGGPYPINAVPAYEILKSTKPECQAVIDVPAASLVGVVFYTAQSKWATVSSAWPTYFSILLIGAFVVVIPSFAALWCYRVSKRWRAGSETPLPSWIRAKLASAGTAGIEDLSRRKRAQRRVSWIDLFTVRPMYTFFYFLLLTSNVAFLVWLFVFKSSFAWNEVVFVIADGLGSFSAASYLVCGCFHPRRPEPALSNRQLLELGRTEYVAVVQCHYNEPAAEILSALRYNLEHFQEFGFSRASRKYYICDDGFFTGCGEERRRRQADFCSALRGVVREVLGTKQYSEKTATDPTGHDDGEPLALAEGTSVDESGIWRADCAEGFLIWSVGRLEDHVYLVARKKPPAHHAKAGNINNFLYNVLQHQYVCDGTMHLGSNDGPPPTYLLLLDQDMCLGHEFVKAQPYYRPVEIVSMALPLMEADLRRTAFVQFPQHFFDMHRMDITFNSNATFYHGVELGRGAVGFAAFSGTNCVWDISKLFSIGGLQYGSVTEDANTSMVAHRHGFRSRYVDAPVAAGNSPQTVEAVIKQVCARWAKGSIEMLFQRCGCAATPQRLCEDRFRMPPLGLEGVYGLDDYDHFKASRKERSMHRGCMEHMVLQIFCIESMIFPVWSVGALLHIVLASNFLLAKSAPLALREPWEVYILIGHALLNLVAPLFAFPRLRVKDMLKSMSAWIGLAPTMITHAVMRATQEKICCCRLRKRTWTSISDASSVMYKPNLMILLCGALLATLMVCSIVQYVMSPNVSERECPTDWADMCDCGWAYGRPWENDPFQAGGFCQQTEDDNSKCRCACCCDFTGECGYIHVHERGTLRPAGTPGPRQTTTTVMANLYAGLLFSLLAPWLYAVLRDFRKTSRPIGFFNEHDSSEPLAALVAHKHFAIATPNMAGTSIDLPLLDDA